MILPAAGAPWGGALSCLSVLQLASQFAQTHKKDVKDLLSNPGADSDDHLKCLQGLIRDLQEIVEKVSNDIHDMLGPLYAEFFGMEYTQASEGFLFGRR